MVIKTKDHRIVLKPYLEIPLCERWLFDNKKAMERLKRGLKHAADGRVTEKGSFVKFIDDID
ncbi:MAG: hypothetical protein PVI75_05165 [Gammaproteobacteria bacterium]|jgi:hypothetical protein